MGRRRASAAWVTLVGILWGAGVGCGEAQLRARPQAYAGVDAQGGVRTMGAALRTMAEQADVVFLGTVVRVERVGSGGAAGWGLSSDGVVQVEFRVERAVRGVAGTSYTLREWGGLWPAGERRYAVGERRLMLLHRPSGLGLSSPVGGMEGAIPVRGGGSRVGETAGGKQAREVADLRWIEAKLVRPVGYRTPAGEGRKGVTGESAGLSLPRAEVRVEGGTDSAVADGEIVGGEPVLVHGVLPRPVAGEGGEPAVNATSMPVADLLTLLQGWGPEERVGR